MTVEKRIYKLKQKLKWFFSNGECREILNAANAYLIKKMGEDIAVEHPQASLDREGYFADHLTMNKKKSAFPILNMVLAFLGVYITFAYFSRSYDAAHILYMAIISAFSSIVLYHLISRDYLLVGIVNCGIRKEESVFVTCALMGALAVQLIPSIMRKLYDDGKQIGTFFEYASTLAILLFLAGTCLAYSQYRKYADLHMGGIVLLYIGLLASAIGFRAYAYHVTRIELFDKVFIGPYWVCLTHYIIWEFLIKTVSRQKGMEDWGEKKL